MIDDIWVIWVQPSRCVTSTLLKYSFIHLFSLFFIPKNSVFPIIITTTIHSSLNSNELLRCNSIHIYDEYKLVDGAIVASIHHLIKKKISRATDGAHKCFKNTSHCVCCVSVRKMNILPRDWLKSVWAGTKGQNGCCHGWIEWMIAHITNYIKWRRFMAKHTRTHV